MNCAKCQSELVKTGVMDSGNSKFDVFKCKNCGEEKIVAQG